MLALRPLSSTRHALYRMPLEADTLLQITHPSTASMGDTNPRLSPSGDRIAFTRTLIDGIQDIHVLPAEGGPVTQVTSDSTRIPGFGWTSDGQQLVFASDREGTSALWRVPAGGGQPERITVASEGAQFGQLSVARQRLAYAQQSGQADIWRLDNPMEYADASTRAFIASTRWDTSPDIAPNGRRVAFVSNRSGYPEVWTITSGGEALRQITTLESRGAHTPRWSPSGEQIAFAARQQGHADLHVVSEEGRAPSRLTRHPAEDLYPSWAPNGDALYFTSNRSGTWEIWKIPARGGTARQVTKGGATAAHVHPDGDRLYVVRTDTTGLWAVPLADTTRTFVFATSSPTDTLADSTGLRRTSPDSAGSPSDSLNGKTVGTLRLVVPDLAPYDRANWHVRDRGIYFLRRASGADVLAFYRFSTHQVSPVFLLRGVPQEPSIAAAPGGEWFLYTRAELQGSDILLVEGFQ